MSSNGLSAAALLMSVTSGERSKIAQKIATHEFSQELAQVQQSQAIVPPVLADTRIMARIMSQAPEMDIHPAVIRTSPGQIFREGLENRADKATAVTSSPASAEVGRAGQAKPKATSQHKAQDSLYVTDLMALERILAQLGISAEARQACQGMGDKQGRIPFKALRAILLSQPVVSGPNGVTQVAARDVSELVGSLSRVENGASAPVDRLKPRSEGSYTLAQLNELLSSLLQEIAERQQIQAPLAERRENTLPILDFHSASTEVPPAIIPRGQVERLATQRIPHFSRVNRDDIDKPQGPEQHASKHWAASVAMTDQGVKPSPEVAVSVRGERFVKAPDEVLRPDLSFGSEFHTGQAGDSLHVKEWEAPRLGMEADSVRGIMEMANPGSGATVPRTAELAGSTLGPRYLSDPAAAAVQASLHPEVAAQVVVTDKGDGRAEQNAMETEYSTAGEHHEPMVEVESRGVVFGGESGGDLGDDPHSEGGLNGRESIQQQSISRRESSKGNAAGFETELLEGARVKDLRFRTENVLDAGSSRNGEDAEGRARMAPSLSEGARMRDSGTEAAASEGGKRGMSEEGLGDRTGAGFSGDVSEGARMRDSGTEAAVSEGGKPGMSEEGLGDRTGAGLSGDVSEGARMRDSGTEAATSEGGKPGMSEEGLGDRTGAVLSRDVSEGGRMRDSGIEAAVSEGGKPGMSEEGLGDRTGAGLARDLPERHPFGTPRSDSTVSADRASEQTGRPQAVEAAVEPPPASDRHEMGLEVRGRGMSLYGQDAGGTDGNEVSEDLSPSREIDRREPARGVDDREVSGAGLERELGEGGRVAQTRQGSAAETDALDPKLRLTESSWADELSKRINDSQRRGRSHLTIELEPENLGKLVLRIETDQGGVSAWVSTQSEEARSVLLQGSSSLRQHMEEQGLTLGQFTVDVGQQQGEPRFQHGGFNQGRGARSPHSTQTQEMSVTKPGSLHSPGASDRLLSVFA